jgi:hypothetical protein
MAYTRATTPVLAFIPCAFILALTIFSACRARAQFRARLLKLKETWSREYADYIDSNGLSTNYTSVLSRADEIID